jgi:hypothetical protein
MQITTAILFLSAAIGVLATPIDSEPVGIDVRDDGLGRLEYLGVSKQPYPPTRLFTL